MPNLWPTDVSAALAPGQRTPERAWAWYRQQPWIVGFNYVSRTAAKMTQFWSADTFDQTTIDCELKWAATLGLNGCGVFVQHLVWQDDRVGLKRPLGVLLALAARRGLKAAAWGGPPEITRRRLDLSDVINFHIRGNCQGL